MHCRDRCIGAIEYAHRRLRSAGNKMSVGKIGDVRIECCGLWNPFLKQLQGSLQGRTRLKSLLHRTAQQQIGQ